MSKLIRVSDEVHAALERMSGGAPLGKVVEAYVTGSAPADITNQMIYDKLIDIELLLEPDPSEKNIALATPNENVAVDAAGVVRPIDPSKPSSYTGGTLKKIERNPAGAAEFNCCGNPNPCKHWQWDGANQQYKNSLSGRVKDAL